MCGLQAAGWKMASGTDRTIICCSSLAFAAAQSQCAAHTEAACKASWSTIGDGRWTDWCVMESGYGRRNRTVCKHRKA